MTPGQQQALRQLERLQAADSDVFQITEGPKMVGELLAAIISLRLGPMEKREGGLELREREDFVLSIPADFPFEQPHLTVQHERFAGFPHVVWSKWLCIYQSQLEWSPADGLYGFFERLRLWLTKAATNDMDPVEGPLEPPHHATDFSQSPFVIRSNSPVEPGESWIGLAELKRFPNRLELVGWNDLSKEWPDTRIPALAIVLPEALPMEFPQRGKEFFIELAKQHIDKEKVLSRLRLAAKLTPDNERAYIVLALPMRRSADGKRKHHVAVWSIASDTARSLRIAAPAENDWRELTEIKNEINELIYQIFESKVITWCHVMEDRDEIIVRRDKHKPAAIFAGKRILILGCGALGSWSAEVVARANCSLVHLVDNSIVKPGVLSRQNYRLDDIGSKKPEALANRIRAISVRVSVESFFEEAHKFIFNDLSRFSAYDLILDCTASAVFQMKLERDWLKLQQHTIPPIVSLVIDSSAQRCLSVALGRNSAAGIWDSYLRLQSRLCATGKHTEFIDAFYSETATKDLFQPEPGCSDPTFSGSMADVGSLVSIALNLAAQKIPAKNEPAGIAFAIPNINSRQTPCDVFDLSHFEEYCVGRYRIRISSNVFREAKACVRENKRVRSRNHETGGLLWGCWDDAIDVIWVFEASGPPPDSQHDPGHFVCGVRGTVEDHKSRMQRTLGFCGFVGFWHTHPDMSSEQSHIDIYGMAELVSKVGQNQKRALMLIFGRTQGKPSAGIYCYESHSLQSNAELLSVGSAQIVLKDNIV